MLNNISIRNCLRFQPIGSVTVTAFSDNDSFHNQFIQIVSCARRLQADILSNRGSFCFGVIGKIRNNGFLHFCVYRRFFIADFYRRFLSPIFSNVSVSIVLSGSSCSVTAGIAHPCSRQALKTRGMPLPERSPISIRLNNFSIVPFRGSDHTTAFSCVYLYTETAGISHGDGITLFDDDQALSCRNNRHEPGSSPMLRAGLYAHWYRHSGTAPPS